MMTILMAMMMMMKQLQHHRSWNHVTSCAHHAVLARATSCLGISQTDTSANAICGVWCVPFDPMCDRDMNSGKHATILDVLMCARQKKVRLCDPLWWLFRVALHKFGCNTCCTINDISDFEAPQCYEHLSLPSLTTVWFAVIAGEIRITSLNAWIPKLAQLSTWEQRWIHSKSTLWSNHKYPIATWPDIKSHTWCHANKNRPHSRPGFGPTALDPGPLRPRPGAAVDGWVFEDWPFTCGGATIHRVAAVEPVLVFARPRPARILRALKAQRKQTD